jgi:hypothetical protein
MREQHRPRRVRSSRGLVRSSRTTERERVVGGHLQETKPDDRTDREWVWLLNIWIPTLRASAVVIIALGFIGARLRKQIRPTDAKVT